MIVGAGASFDCAGEYVRVEERLRPPLVKDLFAGRFADILRGYPLAQQAAVDIRGAIAPNERQDAVPLERYLREQMRDAGDVYTRRRYRQIPLYLQDVLFTVSNTRGRGFTMDPENYSALANRALELDDVLFLTLNYDTLLDERLFSYGGLRSIDSYISNDPKWALVKLHGSVDWGRAFPADFSALEGLINVGTDTGVSLDEREIVNALINAPDDMPFASRAITLRAHADLDRRRRASQEVFYPALSVPIGAEDEIVCPPQHVARAREKLQAADSLNLLVIGYSGLDKEVLSLLTASGRPIGKLLVANGDREASFDAAERVQRACGGGSGVGAMSGFDGGFTELVRTGMLAQFLATI